MAKIKFNIIDKSEVKKAIKKLNKNKTIKSEYYDKLMIAHSEAEKTLIELEEAMIGNILKIKGRWTKEQIAEHLRQAEMQEII